MPHVGLQAANTMQQKPEPVAASPPAAGFIEPYADLH